jgi:hypothetical protein
MCFCGINKNIYMTAKERIGTVKNIKRLEVVN